ncbi:MAG: hypothetical protein ABGZ35_16430 [Planctomycetaceae bacterium]
MFEQLFRFPHALQPHLDGPLAEERRRYLCHRADEGIGRNGVRVMAYYLLACTEYLRLADRPGEPIARAEVEQQAQLEVLAALAPGKAEPSPAAEPAQRLHCKSP